MSDDEIEAGQEARLKARVARLRRRKAIDEPIWAKVREDSEFLSALEEDEEAIQHVADRVGYEYFVRRQRKRGSAAAIKRRESALQLIPAEEIKRAEVLSAHLARLARHLGEDYGVDAEGHPFGNPSYVVQFRNRYLEGRPVAARMAANILSSPAVAFFSHVSFEQPGMLANHTSTLASKRRVLDEHNQIIEEYVVELSWRGEHTKHTQKWVRPERMDVLHLLDRGRPSTVLVFPGTVLDELRRLSERLAEYYGWELAEASWFVLTDVPPSTPCFRIIPKPMWTHDHAHARLEMSVQPWVSMKTVAAVYKRMQRETLLKFQFEKRKSLEVHPTGMRSLELFEFVAERRAKGLPWRALMEEWNSTRPKEESYPEDGVRNFQRDYELIQSRIVWLRWQPLKKLKSSRKGKKA